MARRAGQRSEPLPLAAQRTASALGTLLRAFAGEGDRLWTILPVDPDRLPEVPGLPAVKLISGPVPEGEPTLAWGGTAQIDASVNDRRLAAEIAANAGWSLPGAAVLHSIWAVEKHVADGGADLAPDGRWVAKSPLSAAGRSRAFGGGPPVGKAALNRLQRLLNAQDTLVFEPWMERREDYGVAGRVTETGPEDRRAHRLLSDELGLFRGVEIDPEFREPELVAEAARTAGEVLHARGYRGPFGVDAWSGRDADGASILQPLSEINARYTFGHVARKLTERLGLSRATLRIGHGPVPDAPGVVPLLLPGGEDGTAAWLETDLY
ncbi:MAG: hypothetical protein ABFS86_12270 [Planctomycetota bacterium]